MEASQLLPGPEGPKRKAALAWMQQFPGVYRDNWIVSFTLPFFLFLFIAEFFWLRSQVLVQNSIVLVLEIERRGPCFIPDLRGKACNFSLLSVVLPVGFIRGHRFFSPSFA